MKYNININQKALAGSGLNLKDCAILDYLVMYCNSKSPKIEEQRIAGATWINYQALMDDMPLLEIKTRNSITPRINKIAEAGYITTKVKIIKGNRRVFVKLTDKIDSVFVETTEGVREKDERVRETVHNNNTIDNNTKDTNTKDYKYSLPEPMGKNYQKRIFNFYSLVWNKMYGTFPTADYARLGKTLKSLHDNFSEYQVAMLILKHFEWYGASGSDEYVHRRLVEACFPISWISSSADAYKAVIINSDGIQFDSEDACKIIIDKYLSK